MNDHTIVAQFEEMRQTANDLQRELIRVGPVIRAAAMLHQVEITPVTPSTMVAHAEAKVAAITALGKALERLDK